MMVKAHRYDAVLDAHVRFAESEVRDMARLTRTEALDERGSPRWAVWSDRDWEFGGGFVIRLADRDSTGDDRELLRLTVTDIARALGGGRGHDWEGRIFQGVSEAFAPYMHNDLTVTPAPSPEPVALKDDPPAKTPKPHIFK